MATVKPLSASLAAAAALCLIASASAQSLDAEVRLEGSGRHRNDMNALQLKPFDAGLWSNLSKWSGTPVTPEATKDKVVLIVTWTSYAKTSNNSAINLAQRLHKEYADKGLMVVGIHNPKGFESAAAVATELGVAFPYAADELGKARTALNVDQDPDFYLIDRAGNMRFADIETAATAHAVAITIAETVEQAAAVPGAVSKTAADQQRELMKSRAVKGVVQPGQPLKVPFAPPPDESYKKAKWPGVITKTGVSQFDTLAQRIRKDSPTIALEDEGWVTPKANSNTTGRVTLIYQIDPIDSEVNDIPSKMARLQDAFARDLVIIGTVFEVPDPGTATEEEKAEQKQRRMATAKEIVRQRGLNHGFNIEKFKVGDQGLGEVLIPVASRRHFSIAYLMSTDGRCRWVGNEYWDGFETVVNDFIEADPGIRARRKAEDAAAKAAGN